MRWLSLIPVAIACLIGAALSYAPEAKKATWYVPAFAILGAATASIYALAIQGADTKTSFRYCVAYDMTVLVAYYVFPMLAGSVQPGGRAVAAAVLAVAVAWLLKGGE